MSTEPNLTYVTIKGNPTDERPTEHQYAGLLNELAGKLQYVKHHTMGDGWHYVPKVPIDIIKTDRYWFVGLSTSEVAILVHVKQVCDLLGLDYLSLQKEAYEDQDPYGVKESDYEMVTRPATVADWQTICDDLTDVNYHSLCSVFEEKVKEKLDATTSNPTT